MQDPEEVIRFWLKDVGPDGWYAGGEELDERVRQGFLDLWQLAHQGELQHWLTQPRTTLAYLIVTDQFPRNMFRGSAEAFATDKIARAAAKRAIANEFDMRIDEPERQFFYMPLMHSECLTDQDRCVRLMLTRMPETGADNLVHAKAHREVIRRFGRFPFRNDALSRCTRDDEQSFVDGGGYGQTVEALRA
ncbi:DUF924 family protein [Actibacterium lipolyticum]|uniref:DUF924 domain-containing protein n=1 Tax=Actibacterium lipolyticum TaxID=1524263 RepID=A0A238KJ67_9RHOB|nr:DUF924 family protein [Actibacterium lipolyticum]SMX42737.1 hypothetical protein COL8621_02059 [Actibacterium lipolyticum]